MEPDSEKSETGDESPSEEETPTEEVADAEQWKNQMTQAQQMLTIKSMTVAELKDLLKSRWKTGLRKKADLIARLQE